MKNFYAKCIILLNAFWFQNFSIITSQKFRQGAISEINLAVVFFPVSSPHRRKEVFHVVEEDSDDEE